ncbi:MAG: hypothetical protein Q9194_003876 [Teloschistes cf. exilis]
MAELSLPVIDLAPLSNPHEDHASIEQLATQLGRAFEGEVRLAKKTFRKENNNTYRGFFPARVGSDNLKEGFEIGPHEPSTIPKSREVRIDLTEANVWPSESIASGFQRASEKLYDELQHLSSRLLSLLAVALGKDQSFFHHYLSGSISTLRFLHYPAICPPAPQQDPCCTPHTDSGILTLLHQDATGGLEVLSPDGRWVAAPYVPGSLVVNIGDLMAKVSGGRFNATYHRVRSSPGVERYSVPFFFEPGVDCMVRSVDGDGEVAVYGEHVLTKMKGWVEFQDTEKIPSIVIDVEAINPEKA